MFTMVGLSKTLSDKSKTILKDINLSFYPGAKIVSGIFKASGALMLYILIEEYPIISLPLSLNIKSVLELIFDRIHYDHVLGSRWFKWFWKIHFIENHGWS